MSDTIYRQDVLDALENNWDGNVLHVFDVIKNLQPTCNQLATDCISRREAIDALWQAEKELPYYDSAQVAVNVIKELPSVTPEVIRCKDCRWWDKYGDYDNGYCMAAKHGYWSEHWEISIRRTYKGDFYCADAEPKGEQE